MPLHYSLAGRLATFTPPTPPKSARRRERHASISKLPWPHPDSFTANPKSLAEAGFWHSPSAEETDNVACYMCDKELSSWEDGDDPRAVHVEKCPGCPWVIAFCKLKDEKDKHGNFQIKDPTRNPQHFNLYDARLETFGKGKERWWPHDMIKGHGANSKTMAKAGFCYTPTDDPEDDTSTCFYCGTVLSGWEFTDDPLKEHQRRETAVTCAFLISLSAEKDGTDAEFGRVTGKPATAKSRKGKQKADPSDIEQSDAPLEPEPAPTAAKKGRRKTAAPKPPVPPIPAPSEDEADAHQKAPARTKGRKTIKATPAPTDEDESEAPEPAPTRPKSTRSRKTTKSVVAPQDAGDADVDMAPPAKSTRVRKPPQRYAESEGDAEVIPPPPKTVRRAKSKANLTRKDAPPVEQPEEEPVHIDPPKTPAKGRKGKAKQAIEVYEDTQVALPTEDEEMTTKKPIRGRKTVTGSSSRSRSRSKSVARGAARAKEEDLEQPEPMEEVQEPEPEPTPAPKGRAARGKARGTQTTTDAEETDAGASKPPRKRKTVAPKTPGKKKKQKPPESMEFVTADEDSAAATSEESSAPVIEVHPVAKKKPESKSSQALKTSLPAVPVTKFDFRSKTAQSSEEELSGLLTVDSGPETQTDYTEDVVDVNLESRGPAAPLSDNEPTPKAPRKDKSKSRSASRGPEENHRRLPEVVVPPLQERLAKISIKAKDVVRDATMRTPPPDSEASIPDDEPMAEPAPPFTGGLDAFEALFPGIQLQLPLTNGRRIEIPDLTEAEKDLTVEEWIRLEIDRQYEILKRDGEARIALFKQQGEEARRRIEKL